MTATMTIVIWIVRQKSETDRELTMTTEGTFPTMKMKVKQYHPKVEPGVTRCLLSEPRPWQRVLVTCRK